MTPPKMVPCAFVSLGISTTRIAGSRPDELYSNPVFDSLIRQQPNPNRRQKAKGKRQKAKVRTEAAISPEIISRQTPSSPSYFCLLPFVFSLLLVYCR